MSMEYIRSFYSVPADVGVRIRYGGGKQPREGVIKGAYDAHLCIQLDGDDHFGYYHPTWKLEYLTDPAPEGEQE